MLPILETYHCRAVLEGTKSSWSTYKLEADQGIYLCVPVLSCHPEAIILESSKKDIRNDDSSKMFCTPCRLIENYVAADWLNDTLVERNNNLHAWVLFEQSLRWIYPQWICKCGFDEMSFRKICLLPNPLCHLIAVMSPWNCIRFYCYIARVVLIILTSTS